MHNCYVDAIYIPMIQIFWNKGFLFFFTLFSTSMVESFMFTGQPSEPYFEATFSYFQKNRRKKLGRKSNCVCKICFPAKKNSKYQNNTKIIGIPRGQELHI
jgi:hypothetical protein